MLLMLNHDKSCWNVVDDLVTCWIMMEEHAICWIMLVMLNHDGKTCDMLYHVAHVYHLESSWIMLNHVESCDGRTCYMFNHVPHHDGRTYDIFNYDGITCDMLNHVAHVAHVKSWWKNKLNVKSCCSCWIMINLVGLWWTNLGHVESWRKNIWYVKSSRTCDKLNHDEGTCYKLNHAAHAESWRKNMWYVVSCCSCLPCWIILNQVESCWTMLNHVMEEHVICWIMLLMVNLVESWCKNMW